MAGLPEVLPGEITCARCDSHIEVQYLVTPSGGSTNAAGVYRAHVSLKISDIDLVRAAAWAQGHHGPAVYRLLEPDGMMFV